MKLKTPIECCTTFQYVFARNITKMVFTLFCSVLLIAVTAPARADVCSDAFQAATTNPPPSGCGVTITVAGTSGSLTATTSVGGGPYDGLEDQLVGITNNSSATVGAIVLSGPTGIEGLFGFDGDGPCSFFGTGTCGSTGYNGPLNTFVGISSDNSTGKVLFTTPLSPGQTTWFALEGTPTSVLAIGENKPLTAGLPTTFTFGSSGVDDYVIKPLNSASGDTMTITPYQVPQASFSAANFSTLECVPYKDFNSGSPVCIEIERDCFGTDSCNFLYTAQLDFKIDSTGIPTSATGIGGPRFLGLPGAACPTSGFNQDILVTYIGAIVDPLKGSGSGGGSCWVAAFDPTAAQVSPGVTVGFNGFLGLSTTTNTPVNPGSTEPLNFTYTTSSGTAITNLHWCKSFPNSGSTCTAGALQPWVAFATVPVTCTTGGGPPPGTATDVAGSSNLQNFGGGSYRFNWKTVKDNTLLGTCVTVFTQFDTGKFVFPDNFKYMKQ